jgi:hypothetical protein
MPYLNGVFKPAGSSLGGAPLGNATQWVRPSVLKVYMLSPYAYDHIVSGIHNAIWLGHGHNVSHV